MGLQTVEEVKDTYDLEQGADGAYAVTLADMKAETLAGDAPEDKTPTPETVTCPNSRVTVRPSVECAKCKSREGCPAFATE